MTFASEKQTLQVDKRPLLLFAGGFWPCTDKAVATMCPDRPLAVQKRAWPPSRDPWLNTLPRSLDSGGGRGRRPTQVAHAGWSWPIIAAIVLALLVAAVALWLCWRSHQNQAVGTPATGNPAPARSPSLTQ